MEMNVNSGIVVHFAQIAAFGQLRVLLRIAGFRRRIAGAAAGSAGASAAADAGISPNRTVHQFDFADAILQQRVEGFFGGVNVAAAVAVRDAADADAINDRIGSARGRESAGIFSRPHWRGKNSERSQARSASEK